MSSKSIYDKNPQLPDRMEYFYVIQHKLTKDFYAGAKYAEKTYVHPDQFWNSDHKFPYFTSSKYIKAIILNEGPESFEVLEIIPRPLNDAREFEIAFLKSFDAKNQSNWLNGHNGSNNFRRIHKNFNHSDETKNKIRLGNIGKTMSDESRVKMSKAWETRVVSEDTKLKMSKAKMGVGNNRYGAVVSEETREKIKLGNMGKTRTIESRLKQSLTNKGKPKPKTLCQHCTRFISNNVFGRFHGDKCKSITL